MKAKTLTLLMSSILAVFLFAGLASAVTLSDFTITDPTSINHDDGTFSISFTLENTGTAGDVSLSYTATSGTSTAVFSPTSPITMADGSTTPTTQAVSGTITFDAYQSGTIGGTVTATYGTSTTKTATFSTDITESKELEVEFVDNDDALQVNVTNTGNVLLTDVELTASGDLSSNAVFSANDFALSPGASRVVTISGITEDDVIFGDNSLTVKAQDSIETSATHSAEIIFEEHFCVAGVQGSDLILKDVDLTTDGADDEEWEPLDTVKVDVEVDNIGTDDIDDVVVEIALFDNNGVNAINDVDFLTDDDEKIKIGTIKDGKDDKVTFEFKIPADFDEGDYMLAVKVYSDDLTEELACDDTNTALNQGFYHEIEVEVDEDNLIVIDNLKLSAETATVGDTVRITFDVWNVGDDDEDQVRINVVNADLGINIAEEIKQGIDAGEGEKLELSFTVPSGIKDGSYSIVLSTDYDYDSRNDEYDESSTSTWRTSLEVIGASTTQTALNVEISAVLDSKAQAGKEMTVSSTIKNNEDSAMTFVIGAKKFEDWASLSSISERLVTLNAGESVSVDFVFDVNKGVSGEETFTIEVTSGDKLAEREVAVTIEDSSLLSKLGGDNSLVWIIGIINVVLILLIIIVAVRLSR